MTPEQERRIKEFSMPRTEWDQAIIDYLCEALDITNSDAQGMFNAYDFEVSQEWGKGSSTHVTAERLISL